MAEQEKAPSEEWPEIFVITWSPEFFISIREQSPEYPNEKPLRWIKKESQVVALFGEIKKLEGKKIIIVVDSMYPHTGSDDVMSTSQLINNLSRIRLDVKILGVTRGEGKEWLSKKVVDEIIPFGFLSTLFSGDIKRLTRY
ncbi:MAG: hypothetical protein ABI758_01315 [Candidatus Woesebacteria bacterium]